MAKVSIGFSSPKTWKPLAELIKLVGGTKYSHTFVSWRDPRIERRKVFEAVGSGIRILSNITFKKNAKIIELYQFEVSDQKLIEIERIAHNMAGSPYGYTALVGIAVIKSFNYINDLLGIKGKQERNIFSDGNSSNVCIESAARVLFCILEKPLPDDIESYDLLDYEKLVKEYGIKVSQSKVDKINGETSKKK